MPPSSITPPRSNKRPKANQPWRGCFRFWRDSNCPAASFGARRCRQLLQLLFPVFTQMVVDKVIVENDIGLLKTILLGMFAAIVFVQISSLAKNICSRLPPCGSTRRCLIPQPKTFVATDDLFHEPADGRHPTPPRWRAASAPVRRATRNRRVAGHIYLIGALALMAVYSPLLTLAFLATTPLYVGLMFFSVKVLRPLFAGWKRSQGKYSSHQIDAIKGIEAVKAASAETAFRDAMLNDSSPFRKNCSRPVLSSCHTTACSRPSACSPPQSFCGSAPRK